MRVLITGGSGFIGSHIADRLVERGDDVLASVIQNLFHVARDCAFTQGHLPSGLAMRNYRLEKGEFILRNIETVEHHTNNEKGMEESVSEIKMEEINTEREKRESVRCLRLF